MSMPPVAFVRYKDDPRFLAPHGRPGDFINVTAPGGIYPGFDRGYTWASSPNGDVLYIGVPWDNQILVSRRVWMDGESVRTAPLLGPVRLWPDDSPGYRRPFGISCQRGNDVHVYDLEADAKTSTALKVNGTTLTPYPGARIDYADGFGALVSSCDPCPARTPVYTPYTRGAENSPYTVWVDVRNGMSQADAENVIDQLAGFTGRYGLPTRWTLRPPPKMHPGYYGVARVWHPADYPFGPKGASYDYWTEPVVTMVDRLCHVEGQADKDNVAVVVMHEVCHAHSKNMKHTNDPYNIMAGGYVPLDDRTLYADQRGWMAGTEGQFVWMGGKVWRGPWT